MHYVYWYLSYSFGQPWLTSNGFSSHKIIIYLHKIYTEILYRSILIDSANAKKAMSRYHNNCKTEVLV